MKNYQTGIIIFVLKLFFIIMLLVGWGRTVETKAWAVDCCSVGYTYSPPNNCTDFKSPPLVNNCNNGAFQCVKDLLGKWVCDFSKPAPTAAMPTGAQYVPCKNYIAGAPTGPSGKNQYQLCNDCINANNMYTSLGCIPGDGPGLVGWIIGFGSGIAGGIAILLIIYGGLQLIMSNGIPEKIEHAKETITSAIIGLVFIFVSILILRLIGVQIIGIPGWS